MRELHFFPSHRRLNSERCTSTTTPIQKIITMEKSVAIDFDSIARDAKAQSKELYTWGQSESEDLKDGLCSLPCMF
jgi:hypothetical protein